MIKRVVISKSSTFTFSVIRRIYVNEFDLSAELLFEGVEGDEVVAFDDEVFAYRVVVVALDLGYVLFTFNSVAFPVGKYFRIEQLIDFVLCKDFVEENLFALFFFLCLSAFKDAIFVGPDE